EGGGQAVDTSAQMALFARNLSEMADILGHSREADRYRRTSKQIARAINQLMWNPERHFYYDLRLDGTQAPVATVAAFWTLVSGVADSDQKRDLADALVDPA